jgi:hypothetical protein
MVTKNSRPDAVFSPLLHTIVAAMLVLTVAVPVAAQEADEITEEVSGPPVIRLGEGGFIYQSEADIDGGGSVEVLRFDAGLLGTFKLSERWRWRNAFFLGIHDYDFDDVGARPGEPWNAILNTRLGSALTYALNDTWGLSAGGVFILTPETDADWGDSFTGGGTLGVEYRHSDTLFASVGIAVISQIEDDAEVMPMIGVNWRPDRQWAVRVGAVPASGGAVAAGEVAYRLLEPLELGFGGVYHQRRFRLDDSGVAPEGVGEDNNLPVRLRLGWDITQTIAVNVLGGVVLGGEVELEDRHGNRLRKDDYDPAAYVGLRLQGRL